MAIFDQKTAAKKDTAPFNSDLPPFQAPPAATDTPGTQPASAPRAQGIPAKESLIAGDLTIEGKIEGAGNVRIRSEEHTSELQSLMRISYAVFCLKKKKPTKPHR